MEQKKVSSIDSSVVKDINEALVLNLIKDHGTISSTDLVRITQMRPSTIFNIVKKLTQKDLLIFHGKGDSTDKGGKKPFIWGINDNAAYVVGIGIEFGKVNAVVMNIMGKVIARDSIRINSNKSVIELVEYITKMVSLIIEKAQVGRNKILGVGIAFAGIVNSAEGVVIMSGVLPELNFDLLKKIKEKLPYPVMIENNANASAIGAKWTGEMKTVRNYISVLIEFDSMVGGIGMGIVLEGEIYHGASYASGELFPNLPTLYEMLCAVRSRLSDGKVLKKFAAHVEDIDITILMDAAQQGDETAQLIISRLGNRIGQIIAPAISVLNPEALILTGDIAQVGEMIIKPLRQTIDLEVLSISSKALRITANPQHKYSVAIGAGGVVLSNFFKIPTFS